MGENNNGQQSVGALWLNTSKKGEKYLAGSFGEQKIVVFKNTFKEEGEKTPDYRIFLSQHQDTSTVQKVMNMLDVNPVVPDFEDDDIPF